jgi:hypothetical protein
LVDGGWEEEEEEEEEAVGVAASFGRLAARALCVIARVVAGP